jgi:hypothetical protein
MLRLFTGFELFTMTTMGSPAAPNGPTERINPVAAVMTQITIAVNARPTFFALLIVLLITIPVRT